MVAYVGSEGIIVNNQIYFARLFCLGWRDGGQKIFLEERVEICVSAKLFIFKGFSGFPGFDVSSRNYL